MKSIKYLSFSLGILCVIVAYAGLPTTPVPTPVIDLKVLAQATTLNNLIGDTSKGLNVLEQQKQSVDALERSIQGIGKDNYGPVSDNLQAAISALNQLNSNVSSISYTLNEVSDSFNQDYINKNTPDQYQHNLSVWSQQLQDASNQAMQSQSLITNVIDNNKQAKNILSTSEGDNNNSQVGQLQTVNEMLGVLNSQMGDIATMTGTAGRLMSSQASEQQSQADLQAQSLQSFVVEPPNYQNGQKYSSF
jgi:archaellum component FlaC